MSACRGCGAPLGYVGRGRPRLWCHGCLREQEAARKRAYREANREKLAAQKRAYREANREKVAARNRAYYEANREKVAARQRAYRDSIRAGDRQAPSRWHCKDCGESLSRRTEDGLCGFCRQGIA